ncbi:MAG TPA: DUF1684 domain-containing protein [Acidimicrobiales bacterium]
MNAVNDFDAATFAREWTTWHEGHEQRRSRPLGFLAITGMHWLTSTPERFGDVPGAWSSDAEGIHVDLESDEELIRDGNVVRGRHEFGPFAEGMTIDADFGDNVVEITTRNGLALIRPRHPDNPIRVNYRGTPTYPPSLEWRVLAKFVAAETPQSVTVDVMTEGLHQEYVSPGRAAFELHGRHCSLTLFNDEENALFVLFSDQTAGVTTYGACRSLDVDPPDLEGNLILDFNRATNLPCAYTVFTTCPLPTPENRLAVAIEAGEQRPLPNDAKGNRD